MPFVLHSHSAGRYDPDGVLDAFNLAAKENAKSFYLPDNQ